VGPEQINRKTVERYLPPDTPRPLPTGYYGHLHNIYLHYAAERGIPAMLFLVWMLLMMLIDFQKALRGLPAGPGDRRFILYGATAVVLAAMVAGFFELNLGDSEVLTMFLVAAGCGYAATLKEEVLA
jgi:O-antigen ligase